MVSVSCSKERSDEELIKLAASVEQNSTHPIAKAIVNKANEMEINLYNTSEFENVTGKGLKAKIDSNVVVAGNSVLQYLTTKLPSRFSIIIDLSSAK